MYVLNTHNIMSLILIENVRKALVILSVMHFHIITSYWITQKQQSPETNHKRRLSIDSVLNICLGPCGVLGAVLRTRSPSQSSLMIHWRNLPVNEDLFNFQTAKKMGMKAGAYILLRDVSCSLLFSMSLSTLEDISAFYSTLFWYFWVSDFTCQANILPPQNFLCVNMEIRGWYDCLP